MIKVFDSIVRDNVIKKNVIKFLKKVGAFNNNNFFYSIRFKLLRYKFYVITVV